VRWPEPELTVALAPAHRRYPPELAEAVSDALDHAIAQINRAGAAIRITRDDRLRDPDIIISRPALSQGEKTRKIPRMPNGHTIGVGFMWLWWSERGEVTEASVLIAEDISLEDLHSVMLEELFQCLGFLYDIENPYYDPVTRQQCNHHPHRAGPHGPAPALSIRGRYGENRPRLYPHHR
jgi:hypothetical protein